MENKKTNPPRDETNEKLDACLEMLQKLLEPMDVQQKIQSLNKTRKILNDLSPFTDPVDLVEWIPAEKVLANDYNPNKVASIELDLLHTSICADGFTQPIVAYRLDDEHYEIVDGFHRNKVGQYSDISEKLKGHLPLTVIDKPLAERMGSTIRHNRARGTHQIRSMSDIVLALTKEGWSDAKISENLGMELDEIIRLKQITGLKEAFQNHEFSKSWTEFEHKYYD